MSHSPSFRFVTEQLLLWYNQHGREYLPWRRTGLTPYHIWISEIMLQQTQVSRVVPYFERVISRYPTVQDLAATTWEEFLPYYQGLGYYSRGRNMLKTAQAVVEQFNGEFPSTFDELKSLPGVGPYTAAAILSFGYGEPHLAFDTNQQRVWGRVLEGSKKAAVDPKGIERNLPANTNYQDLNAAIMDFANLVCLSKNPQCEICPLQSQCLYFQTKGDLEPLPASKKTGFPLKEAQTILVLHRQHKEYFSSGKSAQAYQPFVLPAPLNTRERIKEYFARQYGLNLAVRPPHWKGTWNDTTTVMVNAQVLSGETKFLSQDPILFQTWKSKFLAAAQEHE